MFRSFPSGKPLTDPRLKEELGKIFAEYTKSETFERLACFSSTQTNESFSQLVSTKCPKARHYSGSASFSFRVAASVNQKNEGYGYLDNVSMRLGITAKGVLQKYVQLRNLKTKTDRGSKQSLLRKEELLNVCRP